MKICLNIPVLANWLAHHGQLFGLLINGSTPSTYFDTVSFLAFVPVARYSASR